MTRQVFLSHDQRDGQLAKVIAETLTRISLGQIQIWFSSDPSPVGGLKPGQRWVEELESRLSSSCAILVLVTPNSSSRPWLYFESGHGYSRHKCRVVPLCVGLQLSDVPSPLAIFHCVELNDFETLTHFCEKFLAQLRVRFDEEMASPILRLATDKLTSLSSKEGVHSDKSDEGLRNAGGKLEICLEMLRTTWKDMPIPIHSINETGVICGVNKRWLEVFGYQREEVIGKPADFLMTSESAELAMLIVIPEFWERGFCPDVSYQYKKKDGSLVDVILNCVAMTDEDGRRNSLSFVRVVSEQYNLQDLRKESQSRYDVRLCRKSAGFYEMDLFGNFTKVNSYLSRLLGFLKIDEVVGKNFREVVDASAAKSIFNAFHSMFINRVPKGSYLWQIQRKGRSTITVKSTVSLITLPSGKAVGFRGTVQIVDDIAKRQPSELSNIH
jgi:PAS domain S-box-containing protein